MCFLIEPALQYKESYLQAMQEFQDEGTYRIYNLQRVAEHFEEYLTLIKQAQASDVDTPGRVPSADFWLIDNNEFIGRLNLRYKLNEPLLKFGGHIGYEIRPGRRKHGYGKIILRLGLEKAREAGIERVLVTCDDDNIASSKIIEHNGGRLENAVEIPKSSKRKLRYWIDLA